MCTKTNYSDGGDDDGNYDDDLGDGDDNVVEDIGDDNVVEDICDADHKLDESVTFPRI